MKIFRIIVTSLLVAWMVLIFCLSAESAVQSASTSGRLITAVVRFFYSEFDNLSRAEQLAFIEPFQFFVRKGAHFAIYAVLGALSFASVITYKNLNIGIRLLISSMICVLYSVSDEIHQYYVPGRSCQFKDILIDFAGSITAILLLLLITKFKKISQYIYNGNFIRKKELLMLYELASEDVESLTAELESFKFENDLLKTRVEELQNENILIREREEANIKAREIKKNLAVLSPQNELGAKAIGRIIINANIYCNKLKVLSVNNNIKESVNLILGRTECAKAEILKIISENSDVQDIENKISREETNTEDYFLKVLGKI